MKKNRWSRILAVLMIMAIAVMQAPDSFTASAAETGGSVTVIIENSFFKTADGAAWEGSYETEVAYSAEDNGLTLVVKAAEALGMSCNVSNSWGSDYISGIGGLNELDGGYMSGWMGTLNGWLTNEGFSAYSVSNGKITDGDCIKFMYSMDWGADIGADYTVTETTLKSLTVSTGTLDSTFGSENTEYTLTLPEGTTEVSLVPVASNISNQVRTYVNSYTPESDTYYKAGASIPVVSGDVLYIGVGDSAWPGSYYEGTVYTIQLLVENAVPGDDNNDDDNNTGDDDNNAGDDKQPAEVVVPELEKVYEETGSRLADSEITAGVSVGGDWVVIGLARSGLLDDASAEGYYNAVCELVKSNASDKISSSKVTDNARIVLALTALGYDASDVAGYDLTAPLTEKAYVDRQGTNGILWALIALDCGDYETSGADGDYTRETMTESILAAQLEDGGFALKGESGDADLTAIVIQALTPYIEDAEVKAAVDKAVAFLSGIQNDDGSFSSYGSANAESTAQVICALSGLGIDADSDERFVKNTVSALDALLAFYNGDGSFVHLIGGENNAMATEQAYLALTAYYRMSEGKSNIYDMTDTEAPSQAETPADPDTPKTGDSIGIAAAGMLLSFSLILVLKRKESRAF